MDTDFSQLYAQQATSTASSGSGIWNLITLVLIIVGTWKVLQKAGEQGWKILIPFYGDYTKYKIVGMQKAWWKKLILTIVIIIMLAVFFGAAVFAIVGGAAMTSSSSAELASFAGNSLVVTGIATIVLVALAIWALIIECKFLGALSRAFGHGTGFAAGLFFFPYIFYMILGFNGDQFNAPQA